VNFVISELRDLLRAGNNILAIHGLNSTASGIDMLIAPHLVSGLVPDGEAAGIPHAQTDRPRLRFGRSEAVPASGQSNEQFLSIKNPPTTAVDISGWQLTGSIQHRFLAGTVIPAGGVL
jgi:hypothetical protein